MVHQDYGAMLDMFAQQARRFGIVNRLVSLPRDPAGDDEIVQLYANAITKKTKLLMVPHVVNITGLMSQQRVTWSMRAEAGSPSALR